MSLETEGVENEFKIRQILFSIIVNHYQLNMYCHVKCFQYIELIYIFYMD